MLPTTYCFSFAVIPTLVLFETEAHYVFQVGLKFTIALRLNYKCEKPRSPLVTKSLASLDPGFNSILISLPL